MNEEKYYTPDISDLRVGYECETKDCSDSRYDNWAKTILTPSFLDETYKIEGWIEQSYIRTAYLTKEQIEAEGWEYSFQEGLLEIHNYIFKENTSAPPILLRHYPQMKALRIIQEEQQLFKGQCPSINELRYISKLLNIK